VTPPLIGVSGLSSAKATLAVAANQYEICFKCHADSANRPQLTDVSTAGIGFGRTPQRQTDAGSPDAHNTRVQFTQGISFHPVTRSNPVAAVTSLRPNMIAADGSDITSRPLNANTMIYCSDCHASDTNRSLSVGNAGSLGPHGSNIQHLLERQYVLENPPASAGEAGTSATYAIGNYAICDKCHKVEEVIHAGTDTFGVEHKNHVERTSCSTCHSAHGSNSTRLVNFDLSIVGSGSAGTVQFVSTGTGGTCTLKCHGKDHVASSY
jgi:hypothetical protein